MDEATLWVGTYPADGPGGTAGGGEGVWRVTLDRRTGALAGALAVATPSPSFLATSPDGGTLYAAGETSSGTVSAFAVEGERLTPTAVVAAGGDDPCHLLVHPSGRALYVSCYSSGTVAVVQLDDDGRPVGDAPVQVLAGQGSGPRVDRQEGPHAHSALLVDDVLLVADLGTDELRRYAVAGDGTLTPDGVAHRFVPGTGPRHLAVGPGGHLHVVGELTATVHVLRWDAATRTASTVQVVDVSRSPVASGTSHLPAHPVVVGHHLVVSDRGPDVLAHHTIAPDGAALTHVADVPVGGAWPRHVAVVGDPWSAEGAWVVCAVQESGLLTTVRWAGDHLADGPTGRLELPYPACVLPA